MHHFLAAAAVAGLHPIPTPNNGGSTSGPAVGAMTAVFTGGYSSLSPPYTGTSFPGATYQAFHPASMFSALNSVSALHAVSSHGRDGAAASTTVFPPQAGLFHIGGYRTLTGITSANSAIGHQTLQQQQQQAATATLISGSFTVPYYEQPRRMDQVHNAIRHINNNSSNNNKPS
ncbi:hypothetical protein FBUS_09412 [Fasciolopsis buskii]|uniref:Uncharacterized protein n=1 Tax=Fasciolopsis buskii TaxID=27845 RepID=A0A8E0RXM6_9TREM|nr:hypothetical protein FBUS_09412 [Fasciolopsis buski]